MKTISIQNKATLNNNEITGDYKIIGQFCNSNDNLKMYYIVLCPDTNETHIIQLHEIELSRATETI